MRPYINISLVLILSVSGASCARKRAAVRAPAPVPADSLVGYASWYGEPHHGRPTSSGEVYDMHKMTAAHRTLPFGTMVKVINLENQREVVVKINDRGPFVADRIIDLSFEAARRLGIHVKGAGLVRLEVLSEPASRGVFTVQAGAFARRENAERLKRHLKRFGRVKIMQKKGSDKIYRVQVGEFAERAEAEALAARLEREESIRAIVVRID